MDQDVKSIVAKNLTDLRLLNNMTQAELAEKIHYSDKTISKWERAESTPDLPVLVELAELFGVTLDFLVRAENIDERVRENKRVRRQYNRRAITYISESVVWLVAFCAFIITALVAKNASFQWLYFVYAVPLTLILRLILNSVWFNPRNNYMIISLLMWSILATVHITFLFFHQNVSLVYLAGVVGQIIIVLWSFIKKPQK